MLKIRNNVFETNSSSTHSIAISKKSRGYSYDLPVEDGCLKLRCGEFGWGPCLLRTPYDKLTYILTYLICDLLDNEGMDSYIKFGSDDYYKALDLIAEDDDINSLLESIKEECSDIEEFEFGFDDGYYAFGYIDHQSFDMIKDEDFIDVIFNNNIMIIIDNDNSCTFYDWYDNRSKEDIIENLFEKEGDKYDYEAN